MFVDSRALSALFLLLALGCTDPVDGPPGETGDSDVIATCDDCGLHGVCDEVAWTCGCEVGFEWLDDACVALACEDDLACDDADPCNGEETCGSDGVCAAGERVTCDADRVCEAEADLAVCACGPGLTEVDALCVAACEVPRAPVLGELAAAETLRFTASAGVIETAVVALGEEVGDATYEEITILPAVDESGAWRVLARVLDATCVTDDIFDHTYQVAPVYSGPVGADDSVDVASDDPRLVAWASHVLDFAEGDEVHAMWLDSAEALGPASGTSTSVVSLGRGGQLTVGFEAPIEDGPGPDLAVFENAFDDTFLELAYVEVSSDGVTFARFDSAGSQREAVDAYGAVDATRLTGLAGKHRGGHGTPFDLAWLRWHAEVQSGAVDLSSIVAVRLVDVVGDGTDQDSFGRTLYDPFPTVVSAGFDLDAVGVLVTR